jgi:membrane protein implicated in regulation of membrane protease activity
MIDYIVDPSFWLSLGVILIILDILVGLEFFLVSLGVGALLTGGYQFLDGGAYLLPLDSVPKLLLFFAVVSLVVMFPIRRLIYIGGKGGDPDINQY